MEKRVPLSTFRMPTEVFLKHVKTNRKAAFMHVPKVSVSRWLQVRGLDHAPGPIECLFSTARIDPRVLVSLALLSHRYDVHSHFALRVACMHACRQALAAAAAAAAAATRQSPRVVELHRPSIRLSETKDASKRAEIVSVQRSCMHT